MTSRFRAPSVLALGLAAAVPAVLAQSPPSPDLHKVWAVTNCRVVTQASKPALEKAVIVIRDGLVEAVGPGLAVPADAEVVDGAKLTAYPGLIDALGAGLLKMPEEKVDQMRLMSGDVTDKDKGITPEARAFDYAGLGKASVEKWRKLGVLAAQVLPERGLFPGRSSVFALGDGDKNANLIDKDVWLGIGFSPASVFAYPSSLMGVVSYLRQSFSDAAAYDARGARWRQRMAGSARPAYDPRLDVLTPFALGRKPVVFLCRNRYDIRRALELAAEYKLDAAVCDLGSEAFAVLPELKASKVRLLLTAAFKAPATSLAAQEGKDAREKAEKEVYPLNPARVAEAGIPFAFSSLGTDDAKSFMEGVMKAVEAGLPPAKALEALTSAPAAALGLGPALGTIEPGRIANIVLAEGELLAKEPKVRAVFVDGRKIDVKDVKAAEGGAPTVNVTGRWEISMPGTPKLTIDFVQEEASLSGKLTTPFGLFDFTGGTVSGNEFSVEMTLVVGGQSIDLFFTGTVTGDTIRGTVVQGDQGSGEYTAKRIPGL